MKYTVVIEKGRQSGYVAYCPELKGCVTQGPTLKQVKKNIKEAMNLYLRCIKQDKRDLNRKK